MQFWLLPGAEICANGGCLANQRPAVTSVCFRVSIMGRTDVAFAGKRRRESGRRSGCCDSGTIGLTTWKTLEGNVSVSTLEYDFMMEVRHRTALLTVLFWYQMYFLLCSRGLFNVKFVKNVGIILSNHLNITLV